MYLIVGLGNPEEDYKNTRHNMGFDTINKVSEKIGIPISKNKFDGLYGTGIWNGEKIILLKPQTYMNLSGDCVVEFVNFYKVPLENLIVIHDDIDIQPGKVKIRKSGGPGTHNGMKSVCERLNTEEFMRVRIGIGKPQIKGDLINYVIGYMDDESKKILDEATTIASEAVTAIVKDGVDIAMNKYN